MFTLSWMPMQLIPKGALLFRVLFSNVCILVATDQRQVRTDKQGRTGNQSTKLKWWSPFGIVFFHYCPRVKIERATLRCSHQRHRVTLAERVIFFRKWKNKQKCVHGRRQRLKREKHGRSPALRTNFKSSRSVLPSKDLEMCHSFRLRCQ